MKPMIHARSSAKKYGGKAEDYLDIHDFMDSTKSALADVRHRAILHSSFGCFIVEKVFGVERTNSDGRKYSPRDVAEDHCIEDLGRVPSMESWLRNMRIEQWMGGPASRNEKEKRKKQEKSYDDFVEDSGLTAQQASLAMSVKEANEPLFPDKPHVKEVRNIVERYKNPYSSFYIKKSAPNLYYLEERHYPGTEVEWTTRGGPYTLLETNDIIRAGIQNLIWSK